MSEGQRNKRTFNITVGKKSKKMVKKEKKVNEENSKMLDFLFSFIGVSNEDTHQEVQDNQTQRLNLFSDKNMA